MNTLVSNFAHLRNWNPIILAKIIEVYLLKLVAKVSKKVIVRLKRLRQVLSNPPP